MVPRLVTMKHGVQILAALAVFMMVILYGPACYAWPVNTEFWQNHPCGQNVRFVQAVPSLWNAGGTTMTWPGGGTVNITNTAGDLLVVGVGQGGVLTPSAYPNAVFTVTDTNGNTYNASPSVYYSTYSAQQIFYATNIAGGANTITVTGTSLGPPALNNYVNIMVFVTEYTGVATTNAVDISSTASAPTSTFIITPPAMTTTLNCDLVVGAYSDNAPQAFPITGLGWTERGGNNILPAELVDDAAQGGAPQGSVQAQMTAGFGQVSYSWSAAQMAFRNSTTTANAQPTKLAFTTTAQTVANYGCSSALTIQSQNVSGTPTITSIGIPLTLSGTGVTYYVDSACAWPIPSGLIGAGTSSVTYYFSPSDTSTSLTVGATGFSSINQSITTSLGSYVWKGGGGSCNGAWATAACWSGGAAPGTGNTAHFDSTCTTTNCSPSIAANIDVGGIWIHSDYTGTITQQTTKTVTIENSYEQDAGTFTGGSGAITDKGTFTLTGGTFTSTSGTFTMSGANYAPNFTISGSPTFNNNGGTVSFATASTVFPLYYITPGSITFNNVTINNLGANSVGTISGTMNISGTFTLSSVTSGLLNGGTLSLSGNMTVSGGGGGTTAITFTGTNAQSYTRTAGTIPTGTITVNKSSGTLTPANNWTLAANQSLNITSGTLALGTYNLTTGAGGNITIGTSGTLTSSTGTITVGGNWTNNGTFTASGADTISLAGNWTNSGTFTPSTGTVTLTNANHTFAGTTSFYNLSMTGPTATRILTFPASTTTTVTNTLTLTGASGKLIQLRSSASPTQWTLTPPASTTLGGYIDVMDSASTVVIHSGAHYTNSGNNNVNWIFP